MAKKDEAVFVGIDDQVIEVIGADKDEILAEQKVVKDNVLLRETEYKAKQEARESAIKKLADIAGLTKEELASIL
jgi:hypothetical protein